MSVRYDWYQTDDKIVITIMLKDAANKNGKVIIEEERVSVTADDTEPLVLDLFDRVNVERSTYRIIPVKIEITLVKSNGIRWSDLKRKEIAEAEKEAGMARIFRTDWDNVSREIEKDIKNDEDDLNVLFQTIYSSSTDEVRKAMNKSFTESGGTVLSTNWNEISQKRVDIKPPDGAEFKKWE